MRTFTLGLAALAVLVVACGGDTTEPDTAPASTTTAVTETTTTSTPGSTTSTAAPAVTTTIAGEHVFEITVSGSDVVGGGRIGVLLGDTVTLRVTSDVADEVHVHGYDLRLELEAGVTGEVSFEATIPGVVEVELEEAGLVLVALESS